MVERCVRDAEVGGSNPLTPTRPPLPAALRREPGTRGRFLDSVEDALVFLEKNPLVWRPDSLGRRKYHIRHFPYLIIYRYHEERIYGPAIAHAIKKAWVLEGKGHGQAIIAAPPLGDSQARHEGGTGWRPLRRWPS